MIVKIQLIQKNVQDHVNVIIVVVQNVLKNHSVHHVINVIEVDQDHVIAIIQKVVIVVKNHHQDIMIIKEDQDQDHMIINVHINQILRNVIQAIDLNHDQKINYHQHLLQQNNIKTNCVYGKRWY